YEQVLLLHDPVAGRQHFVRDVAFREAREPFGFVVPTPTRPRVASVKTSPFKLLRELLPFAPRQSDRPGHGFGGGRGGSRASSGVTILEVSKVGSFTAF